MCVFGSHLFSIVNGTKHYPLDIEEAIRAATTPCIQVAARAAQPAAPARGMRSATPPTAATPARSIRLRPGGILAAEVEDKATGKNELVVMVELMDAEAPAAVTEGKAAGSAGGGSSSSGGKSQMAVANAVFKQVQRLPASIRTPTIKCLARMGARWQKYSKERAAAAAAATAAAAGGESAEGGGAASRGCGYSVHELEQVEKAVRRAVIGRFGIPVAEVILLRSVRATAQHGHWIRQPQRCLPSCLTLMITPLPIASLFLFFS